jgi:DNA-binding beta-propeller fold protein YncE
MDPSCLGLLADGTQGAYVFTIRATNSAGITDQTFTLNLEHDTSLLGAAPSTLSFATDGTYEPAETVSLTTWGDTLPYALVTTASWLKATPESGWMPTTTETNLVVSADAAGLAPGTYTGTVIVGSAGTEGPFATIAVTLIVEGVSEPGMVGIWPSALSFDYHVNDGITPPAQTVWVMSGGEALDYTVSIEGGRWVSAPAGGTSPGGFRVSVDPKVGVGMHIANLTIEAEGALNGPQTIPVTLVKTAGDSDLIQVMMDVGDGPEGIAANLNTHNLFITSSSGSAEAAEESGSETEVPTTGLPEPQLVFHINPLDLTVLGEIVVHSEGEYIGVNSTTGMAYQASEGTSEIAVIDGDTNTVVAFIPLTIPEGPCIPYQIAIDEAQNIIYVGAKSPEPEGTYPNPLEGPPYGCKAIRELPSDEVPEGELPELDCWHAGPVFVIDGYTNQVVSYFLAGDDPEGVVFAAATGKVYASNEDDGNVTVAQGAIRNGDGSITAPEVLGTIIQGSLDTEWQLECDEETNYCGEREVLQMWLWPDLSACHGIDDEAEEADKMTVDPDGNVYIIDDRYRVAKIDGQTDAVVEVIEIPDYDCECTVPDDSPDVLRNTANNIAYMPLGQGKLYVVSEQNTVTLIEWKQTGKKKRVATLTTLTIPGAVELDAITTDPALNQVYITDEDLASLWILKGACANGVGVHCVP